MPRGSSEYREAAAAPAISTAWLVAIPSLPTLNDPSSTVELFFTDWPEPVSYGGKTYLPSPLQISAPKFTKDMERAAGSIALCNLPNTFTEYAKNYRLEDSQIVVTHAVLNESAWIGLVSFVGIIDAPTVAEDRISVGISSGRSVATLVPRRLFWSRDFPHLPSAKNPRALSLK